MSGIQLKCREYICSCLNRIDVAVFLANLLCSLGRCFQQKIIGCSGQYRVTSLIFDIIYFHTHRGGCAGGYKELDEEEIEETRRRRKEAEEVHILVCFY